MSEFTPTVAAFRGVYGQMCAEWCRDDALAEFDRLIARIKAEALREAADEYATSNREQAHGVTSVLMFMHHRADRIEVSDEAYRVHESRS